MRSIKIGTRNSPLAMWQAREVARNLQNLNYTTDIIPVLATGDKNLTQPLYTLGITGIFTKDLDIALLNNEVDIAVHSLKDIPTELPENIEIIAVLERDYPQDVLVRKKDAETLELHDLKIATSSLRRRAFWLKEFPDTQFSDIRGNVQTRLNKLEELDFDATMFSLAAIERMCLNVDYEHLPIMISAPAQGVVAVCARRDDAEIKEIFKDINHKPTQICIEIERNFLNTLEGGCTAPIGAFAEINDRNEVRFIGRLCSLDGKNCIETDEIFEWNEHENFGKMLAQKVLENGGRELMKQIKSEL
ncbi:hydroxymethylbilane synthase [Chryseobacterium sp. HSC-36S06]|uniref:hydroxymethylbilane synthase n=1 Tax=Chryseobacterium sp. HSC-36S06 TaxID=2910970 RepID=UPI00209F90D5|nr:hydroxymethylbilane synthase [Chryseobacterium sp. HSC-36S06]MCP2037295.1 hydroxymethylbilane synthase [Chryseobacterium sp. HSC-36S06]